jgi:hypothetical protein
MAYRFTRKERERMTKEVLRRLGRDVDPVPGRIDHTPKVEIRSVIFDPWSKPAMARPGNVKRARRLVVRKLRKMSDF